MGYAMGERMTPNLVQSVSIPGAESQTPCETGLMHHSDRGSQYCSQEHRNLMQHSGLRSSMSGIFNCPDNAPMKKVLAEHSSRS